MACLTLDVNGGERLMRNLLPAQRRSKVQRPGRMWRMADPIKARFEKKPHTTGVRVLLLEDDEADAYLTTSALAKIENVKTVVRVVNGMAGINLLKRGMLFDLALVDIHMPKMSGLDFMSACVEAGLPCMPMIIFTSSAAESDRIRSRSKGAMAVITKPADNEDFERVLRTIVSAYGRHVEAEMIDGRPSWFEAVEASRRPSVDDPANGHVSSSY